MPCGAYQYLEFFRFINIPIFLFTAKVVGKTFVIRTLYSDIITSFRLVLF
ncbi:YitT family protein [Rossellomorea aquimaris]